MKVRLFENNDRQVILPKRRNMMVKIIDEMLLDPNLIYTKDEIENVDFFNKESALLIQMRLLTVESDDVLDVLKGRIKNLGENVDESGRAYDGLSITEISNYRPFIDGVPTTRITYWYQFSKEEQDIWEDNPYEFKY